MLPPALPRWARGAYRRLEESYATWASCSARDQRSPVNRKARETAWLRYQDAVVTIAAYLGVPAEVERFPGCPSWYPRWTEARTAVGTSFPQYTWRGGEVAERVANERRRRNGARVRATRRRNGR